jgi:hypothetical protein
MAGKVAECSSANLDVNSTCHLCPEDQAGSLSCFAFFKYGHLKDFIPNGNDETRR